MNIYSFPPYSDKSDFVLLDLYNPYQNTLSGPCGVCINPISYKEYYDNIFKLFDNENYGVYLYDDGYLLFKKGFERTKNQYALSQVKNIINGLTKE